ncbi:MAG: RHS repeat-associated core domain-containing protein, partial [bacterium]
MSGVLFYGYRYYSPGLGRWINRDQIQEKGGLNVYSFLRNCSVNAVDLFGLIQWGTLAEQPGSGIMPGGIAVKFYKVKTDDGTT